MTPHMRGRGTKLAERLDRIDGGSGSGGAAYDETDGRRSVALLGQMSANSSATLQIHDGTGPVDGTGQCSGHSLLSGGTRPLVDRIDCVGEHPETFLENYITVMLLDEDGHLQRDESLIFKVFSFQPAPHVQENFGEGAVTISSSNVYVQRGSRYTFELSSPNIDSDATIDERFDDLDLDDYQFLVLVEYPDTRLYREVLVIGENGRTDFTIP